MKITALEVTHITPRWAILAMRTDRGITGFGEPVLEGKARSVETAVREYAEYLVGKDPRRIEHHLQVMYRGGFYRGGPVLMSAISGIEQALWDIKGKELGVPIYELFGGACRERIRVYPHLGAAVDDRIPGRGRDAAGAGSAPTGVADDSAVIAAFAAAARARAAAGFTALKFSPPAPARAIETQAYINTVARRFAGMRQAVGDEFDIAVDFHGRITPATAVRLAKALEPFGPLFVEEPCLPENVPAMAEIARATSVPIATGERLVTRFEFRELLERRVAAVLQPDLCHCGGIFEGRKIAAMAEAYYVSIAPHNPLGPLSLAACLQLDACIPNFLIQEYAGRADGMDLGAGILTTPFKVHAGHIDVPTAPGLGVEVDEAALAALRYDGSWTSPLLFHDDGSVADW